MDVRVGVVTESGGCREAELRVVLSPGLESVGRCCAGGESTARELVNGETAAFDETGADATGGGAPGTFRMRTPVGVPVVCGFPTILWDISCALADSELVAVIPLGAELVEAPALGLFERMCGLGKGTAEGKRVIGGGLDTGIG